MNPGEQPREIRINFEDESATELLLASRIGHNLYRMEESSALGQVTYHDIIETKPQGDGSVRSLRVAR